MYIKLILIFFCLISLSKQHPGGHAGGEAREEIGKLKSEVAKRNIENLGLQPNIKLCEFRCCEKNE